MVKFVSSIPPHASAVARQNKMRRGRTFKMTGGRCFYCGNPLLHKGYVDERDWILVRPHQHRMVQEHKTPVSRAGANHPSNFVPSCSRCNYFKGPFTLEEFRFLRGLEHGDLGFSFAYEPQVAQRRDWLICHSPGFERALVVHNIPSAADGYELRVRAGGPMALQEPRVRPVR